MESFIEAAVIHWEQHLYAESLIYFYEKLRNTKLNTEKYGKCINSSYKYKI